MKEIETLAADAFEAGRAVWPGVRLNLPTFAGRISAMGVEADALAQRGPDLFLAVACGLNDEVAVSFFERTFLAGVARQLGRVVLKAQEEDELKQQLRMKLLVGPGAKIHEYRGSGPLGAWVRVCALRLALDLTSAAEVLRRNDNQALDTLVASTPQGELMIDRERHRESFRQALQEALASLSTKEKSILRLHFLDGMNIDALGIMFRVHRATVARWLVAIRTGVLNHVRQRLSLDLGASASEAHSLVRLLSPDVQVSVQRIVGSDCDAR